MISILVIVALLSLHPATLASLTVETFDLKCGASNSTFKIEAAYRIWRSVHIGWNSFRATEGCFIDVILGPASLPLQPGQLLPLLLVKVEPLRLIESRDSIYVLMRNPTRWSYPLCSSVQCDATYLWASDTVQLYTNKYPSAPFSASYKTQFLVTEGTNVCGQAGHSGELLVKSSSSIRQYAFAPDVIFNLLPPSNPTCTADFNYSLTLRPYDASALLRMTVLACPSSAGCATLLLNDRLCRGGESFLAPLSSSRVMLSYLLRSCSGYAKYTGFVVSAYARALDAVSSSLRPLSTPGAGSWSGVAVTNSSSLDFMAGGGGSDERHTTEASNQTVVTASVAAVAAAALAIGITIALLYRHSRLRQRSNARTLPSNVLHQTQNAATAGDEEMAMVDNELYGVALTTRKAAC